MSSERDTNHVPYRAGAMLLVSLAIVCIGLGWHAAVSGSNNGDSDLKNAATHESTSQQVSTPQQPKPSGSASSSSPSAGASSSSAEASATAPAVCVLNAGTVGGLADTVTDKLKTQGYRTIAPKNLTSASITENTIFYPSGAQEAAQRVASDLGGDPSVEARPTAFTPCDGDIAVIVVN